MAASDYGSEYVPPFRGQDYISGLVTRWHEMMAKSGESRKFFQMFHTMASELGDFLSDEELKEVFGGCDKKGSIVAKEAITRLSTVFHERVLGTKWLIHTSPENNPMYPQPGGVPYASHMQLLRIFFDLDPRSLEHWYLWLKRNELLLHNTNPGGLVNIKEYVTHPLDRWESKWGMEPVGITKIKSEKKRRVPMKGQTPGSKGEKMAEALDEGMRTPVNVDDEMAEQREAITAGRKDLDDKLPPAEIWDRSKEKLHEWKERYLGKFEDPEQREKEEKRLKEAPNFMRLILSNPMKLMTLRNRNDYQLALRELQVIVRHCQEELKSSNVNLLQPFVEPGLQVETVDWQRRQR